MLTLSPIALFQATQKEIAADHAANVRSSKFTTVLNFALAEMAFRNMTNEELRGARIYIGILMNMGEKPETIKPPAPSKDLKK